MQRNFPKRAPRAVARSLPLPRPTLRPILLVGWALLALLTWALWAAGPLSAAGPTLRQLTQGGCCTQPSWSVDSKQVFFIDKPSAQAALGIWGVNAASGGAPTLVTQRIASYTADMAYLVDLSQGATVIERVADRTRWTVPAGGRSVSISPNRTQIAWQTNNDNTTQIWIANIDGTKARAVATLTRGGISGWVSDNVLLLSRRATAQSQVQIYSTLSLATGTTTEVTRGERLGGVLISPDGRWMAYTITLTKDASQNGLWVVRTDGTGKRKLDRALFGAYQWRDGNRLLLLPLRPNATHHEFWEYQAEAGTSRQLTNAAVTPFKIANGDWRVSPNGKMVVFLSADKNLWVLELPS